MKKVRNLIGSLLFLGLLIASALPVLAADNYTYTVRIFAGGQGTISGETMEVHTGLAYGDRVNFDLTKVTLDTDSKYYVKGIRESGKDNDTVDSPSIYVDGDIDYVVAYGIRGNLVSYTVNYQDASGTTLLPSATFYGNVGDKPVVAYQYIEGYQPQAYNLTRTLSENASANVFTFVYRAIATPQTPAGGTTGGTTNGGTTTVVQGGGTGGNNNNNNNTTTTEGNNTTETEETETETPTETIPETETPAAEPQEVIDLDDNDTPLASFPNGADASPSANAQAVQANAGKLPVAAKVGVGAGAALVLGLLAFFLYRKKKKNEEEPIQF